MSRINLNSLDNMQYDILKELGNIGAGNATTALAKMINSKVDMKVPKVELVGFNQIADIIGNEEQLMVGILLLLEGEVSGMMMFLQEINCAKNLVSEIMQCPCSDNEYGFSEMELSALNEVGNIITGAYLSALSDLTKLTIVSSVPSTQVDMAAAILSIPAIEFGKIGDKVLFIQTQFDNDASIDGYFLLIPELESYDKILSSLGL